MLVTAGLLASLSACGGEAADDRAAPASDADDRRAQVMDLSEEELLERAREIHARVITIDTHVDIPNNYATDEVDPGVRGSFQVDLPKMREGGLDAAFFIVYQAQGERTEEGKALARRIAQTKFDAIRRMTYEMYPDQIELAYSAADVERIHAEGKLVALIGVENAFGLGTDLDTWDRYHELGARYVSLTHNGHNDFGDAAVERPQLGDDGPEWGGLSPLGREAVESLNQLGIMVDVSHAGRETMLQIVEHSRAPVIASHSSVSGITDHPRNLDDEQLRALAARGGVAQTTALGAFVRRPGNEGDATLEEYIDHVDYAVELVGIDHVGISSDFDGGGGVVGWQDASETLNVTLELVRRGYSEEEIRKLWGGNLLRVLREVERVAGEIQDEQGAGE
jgi:membrane dipeptidase